LNWHCIAVLFYCKSPILETPHPGKQSKQGLYKNIIYS
jgi:hypothetical protein